MSDGFFARWSRRKAEVREGKPAEAETTTALRPDGDTQVPREDLRPPLEESRHPVEESPNAPEPPPTLADVHSLTPESDFSRFVRPDVPPDVKNAAVRKLFADPHFNQMDGLDVYIDDYSKPDPLPPEMLKQLASAKFLNFFDDTKEDEDDSPRESVAQSATGEPEVPSPESDADPDLRLQQDDAPGPEGPGEGRS